MFGEGSAQIYRGAREATWVSLFHWWVDTDDTVAAAEAALAEAEAEAAAPGWKAPEEAAVHTAAAITRALCEAIISVWTCSFPGTEACVNARQLYGPRTWPKGVKSLNSTRCLEAPERSMYKTPKFQHK